MSKLRLIKFFEHFDKGNPYHRAAIAELEAQLPPDLLARDNTWFHIWSQAGKRDA